MAKKRETDEQDLLFREVDDDLRQDQINSLWKRYGRYVIGGAVAIVLSVSGVTLWEAYLANKESAASNAFDAALEAAGAEGADVTAVWSEAAANLEGGYAALGMLHEAAALYDAGDAEGAIAVLTALGSDSDASETMSSLGQLIAAKIEIELTKYPEARGRLTLLTGPENVWRASASEMLAVIHLAEGNNEEAYRAFSALVASDAPQPIQQRAREMADSLRAYAPKPAVITDEAETADESETPSEAADEEQTDG